MTRKEEKMPDMAELMAYLNKQTGDITKQRIARDLKIKGDARKELKGMLKTLKAQGILETGAKGRHNQLRVAGKLPETCKIEITGQDSMGDLIARPVEWTSSQPAPQILITKNKINPPAGVGDIVQARLKEVGEKMYEAAVLQRIVRANNQMVMVYENGYVYSVDRRLTQPFRLLDVPRGVENKDLLLVEIPASRSREPEAHFVQKIGSSTDPHAATLISIYLHRLPVAFTEGSENEAAHLGIPSVDEHRIDLTHIPFVTIDGADARDFDDAVFAEVDSNPENPDGFHVMIGIADVAWYVRSGSALDYDARLRGNSVYFPDRVIPMLPVELSNGVCSLKPNEKRASLVCELWLNKKGVKLRHRFVRALIQSARRLTYPEVQEAIDGQLDIRGLEKEINALQSVFLLLKKRRQQRGVIEIDIPEQQVQLNNTGEVIGICPRYQTQSMQLIEELMILANVSAAETLEEKGVPAMYRVHAHPSEEKIKFLNGFLMASGIHLSSPLSQQSLPSDFNDILVKANGTPKAFAVNEFILRAQSQAVYSPDNIGHFGLALLRYAHFTSPIRRYADILVHRALISALQLGEGGLSKADEEVFADTARHISQRERQAASAEQDSVDRYVAAFMKNQINKSFNAHISSVNTFGMFIHLVKSGICGFVPLRFIKGDYYDYDDKKKALVGRSSGKKWCVGDSVTVVLKEAVPLTGGLLFQTRT